MASTADFAEFIAEQLADAGDVSMRKMFGEYAVYGDEKVVALVCDNQLFVKKTKAGADLLGPGADEAPPYPGAAPHYLIVDVDNRELLSRLFLATRDELPRTKPRKSRNAGKPSGRRKHRPSSGE